MNPTVTAVLAVVALVAGTIDAIAGGGGLLTVPALLAAGLPPHVALATNKGQSTWGSCASMITFWRAGKVDGAQAMWTFPLAVAGSVAGARLVMWMSPEALQPVVIALLVVAAIVMAMRRPTADGDGPRRLGVACALAAVIGCYDGFFGPGTGTFLVVGFVALCGRSLVHATADAKVVNFGANLAALVTFALSGAVVWEVALPMAAGQLLGGLVGARIAIEGGARIVRVAVLAVSGVLIARLAYQLIG